MGGKVRFGELQGISVDRYSAGAILIRLFREHMLPHWRKLAVTVAATLATAVTAGALPFLMQKVADELFVAKNPDLLFVLPGLVLLTITARGAADWAATVSAAALGTRVVADLRMRLFEAIAAADLAWIQRSHSGHFVSVFLSETALVDRSAARVVLVLAKNVLSVVFLVGAMFYMDWRLSLAALVGAPFAFLHLGQQKKRIRRAVGRSLEQTGNLGSMLTQTLQSLRVVKAYNQEENEARRFRQIIEKVRRYLMKSTRSRAAVGPVSEAFSGVGIAAAVLYGGWQGIYGDVSLGHFMGFMAAALLAFAPLKSLAATQATLSEGLFAAARVFAVLDRTSEVAEKPGAAPLRVSRGAISFRDVSFAYPERGPILCDFNLEILPGQKVALVGPSGAGKSTVLNLLLRFFDPGRGAILVDGQDLRDATLASVRAASALLTQDPVVFDDTVLANIAYGSEGVTEAEIVAAAEAAAAHEFITRMPDGYATQVGEAGGRLSGGERQRIAFARAMLRNSPILLLDEPTSALDAESEAKVQAAMDRLLQGRTVLMIAHRLSTVRRADLICVMEGGRIVETGSHLELVARRGRYARMFQAQLAGEEPRLALAEA